MEITTSCQFLPLAWLTDTIAHQVRPFAPLPLQQLHHYYERIRHPARLRFITFLNIVLPFAIPLPYGQVHAWPASLQDFLSSPKQPVYRSCPLYHGCRTDSNQLAPVPLSHRTGRPHGLDNRFIVLETSSRVHLRSSPYRLPDIS